MTHKRSEKEIRYLRELLGADGQKAHYFGGSPEQRHETAHKRSNTSGKAAQQIAEMRAAAGGRKATSARDKARAAKQVAEMRRAAGHTKGPAK